jgi:xanthine/uracil permease
MIPMLVDGFTPLVERARRLFPAVVTLLVFLLLAAALASTYFGHSRSPYDGCQGTNGRAVSCAILEALR